MGKYPIGKNPAVRFINQTTTSINILESSWKTFSFFAGLSKPVITNHNFLAVYFDRRHKDLKLLLNLLAETSGLPESFRILTLFDKKFQSLWKPQNLRFEEYETVLPNRTVKSRYIFPFSFVFNLKGTANQYNLF